MPFPPPYGPIRQAFLDGQIIPFLGAGASLAARVPPGNAWAAASAFLPNGSELADHLAKESGFPPGEARDLAKVAQYFHVQAGRPLLHKELRKIFQRAYAPLPIHGLLASAQKPLLVVTTNYDSLIEQAFASANRPYDLVIHTTDSQIGERIYHRAHGEMTLNKVVPRKLLIDLGTRSVVYKIHGSCDAADPTKDQYVITEDDYIDFLSRMVKNTAIPAFCAEPFQCWPFLFIGYRLGDWNMRVVLNRISPTVRLEQGIKSWAIERAPSALEERFWMTRGVNVYPKPIDDFVTELSALGSI